MEKGKSFGANRAGQKIEHNADEMEHYVRLRIETGQASVMAASEVARPAGVLQPHDTLLHRDGCAMGLYRPEQR